MSRLLQETMDSLKGGVVDFTAQRLLQSFLLQISVLGSLLGFCFGFLTESFYHCVLTLLVTFLIASIVCIPSWPLYKRNQIDWEPHDPKRIAELYAIERGPPPTSQGAPKKEASVAPAKGNSGKKKGAADIKKRK